MSSNKNAGRNAPAVIDDFDEATGGFDAEFLHNAQYNFRAIIAPGHEPAEIFANDGELSVMILQTEHQGLVGYSQSVRPTKIKDMTEGEWTLMIGSNHPRAIEQFKKVHNIESDEDDVSYIVFDTKRHSIITADSRGIIHQQFKNTDFVLRLNS